MDAGESFIKQCSEKAFYNTEELECIINAVNSIELLGNGESFHAGDILPIGLAFQHLYCLKRTRSGS